MKILFFFLFGAAVLKLLQILLHSIGIFESDNPFLG